MPWSGGTGGRPVEGPLVAGGRGTEADFQRLGTVVRGAWLLIAMDPLLDLDGLFREYAESAEIERRAWAAGAAGVVYQSSRPEGGLYRHNAALGWDNRQPVLAMERAAAARARRLLASGAALRLSANIQVTRSGPYAADNVIGEIAGASRPGEIVVIGAHLDSWDLGQGALDNGANVVMLIDIARQIARLGLRPARTIRFALWNGEEQGLVGSWRYTEQHAGELDRTVLAASFDIGTGNITGFLTGGRPDVLAAVQRALEPVPNAVPWQHADVPIVGTDNYDFMLQGVPNIVANQEPANYGPNYHASSDTFDKADTVAMRRNARIAAAVAWYWASAEQVPGRHTMAQVEALVRQSDLRAQMRMMGDLLDRWEDRTRPRRP
jgi:Zn-dependent M28 family amino/carboxypeptidase